MTLEPGAYRLRRWGGGTEGRVVRISRNAGEIRASSAPALRGNSPGGEDRLVILGRMARSDQAATAAEVTAMQIFRELCPGAAPRPGARGPRIPPAVAVTLNGMLDYFGWTVKTASMRSDRSDGADRVAGGQAAADPAVRAVAGALG